MDPRPDKPGILRPSMTHGVPLIGGTQALQIVISKLCVNCFPKPQPAVFVWGGHSLCQQCFVPLRQEIDRDHAIHAPGIENRDYKETWGKDPEEGE